MNKNLILGWLAGLALMLIFFTIPRFTWLKTAFFIYASERQSFLEQAYFSIIASSLSGLLGGYIGDKINQKWVLSVTLDIVLTLPVFFIFFIMNMS